MHPDGVSKSPKMSGIRLLLSIVTSPHNTIVCLSSVAETNSKINYRKKNVFRRIKKCLVKFHTIFFMANDLKKKLSTAMKRKSVMYKVLKAFVYLFVFILMLSDNI